VNQNEAKQSSHPSRNRDAWAINVDLHCHSTFSDGVLEPAELVARAHGNGVQVLALTDHDETSGLQAARTSAKALGMTLINGVEISVTWAGYTLHIVGLGIDPENANLVAGLEDIRTGREARARAMGDGLARHGIDGVYEGATKYATNPVLVSRTHFARHLVHTGVCKHMSEVFQRFLVPGKPGYVPHQWASLSDAVGWINCAGGQAVIAHPGRYRLPDTELWALMTEFREAGGVAIEVVTGSHTKDEYKRFATVAREHDFKASRGSDFHSPKESRLDLGELPPLPDSVVPVWADWKQLANLGAHSA
jgi:predicted metal-dependent phosphoesterase TrpH